MKPPPFKYLAPNSLDEALEQLAEYGDEAKVLAGGQSFVPIMNFRLAQPAVLIDLNGISELFYIKDKKNCLQIGAMTRHSKVEQNELVKKHTPLIHETMPNIAHPQIRNRGTIGGSIAHADPAAELPAVMLALDASYRVRSKARGERVIPAREFHQGLFTTALEPDEILTEIRIPPSPARTGCAFQEIARRHGDFALVGVAAVVTLDQKNICRNAQLVFLSVGDEPVKAHEAMKMLAGQVLSESTIRAASETAAAKDISPASDIHASAAFRRHLAKVLAERALTSAFAGAVWHRGWRAARRVTKSMAP